MTGLPSDQPALPRGMPNGSSIAPLATAAWFDANELRRQTESGGALSYAPGKLWLGRTPDDRARPAGWMDDRHMVTIAGSRAGKGVSAIIPALCEYPGSVLCFDPKGENARRTAARRGYGTSRVTGLHQTIITLDPYRVSGAPHAYQATFDPLHDLEAADEETAIERAELIADACIVAADERDAHWDETSRAFWQAVILHVLSWPDYDGARTLPFAARLVRDGDTAELEAYKRALPESDHGSPLPSAFDLLLAAMETNPAYDGLVAGAAAGLRALGDRERGSILSTLRRNIKFLTLPRMRDSLVPSEHMLKVEDLKRDPYGMTVYVCLPARHIRSHGRWLRILLNLSVAALERDPEPPATGHPVLAILDEFPTLRHLPILETAVGYMAGFGLKIWAILQDLSQLKRDYPKSWETFLGNAGLIQAFGNTDLTTLEFLAKRLGETEVIRETVNRSTTETESTSDISDFEKTRKASEAAGLSRALASFALENDTRNRARSRAEAETHSQSVQKAQLLTPDEIRRHFARGTGLQLILLSDMPPISLRRGMYFDDPQFSDKFT